MTRTEQAEMAELHMDEVTLAQRQQKISLMIGDNPTSYTDALARSQQGPGDSAAENQAQSRKQRSTPVRGVCVNCGKNWSRHYNRHDDVMLAYCEKSGTRKFTLERTPEPAAPVQAGKLTSEQVSRLRDLDASIERARIEWDTASAHMRDKESAYWTLKNEREEFYKELTQ